MALIATTGKLGEGKTYRYRNGQSGAGMLSGWQRSEVRVSGAKAQSAATKAPQAQRGAVAVRALPVGNHGENVR